MSSNCSLRVWFALLLMLVLSGCGLEPPDTLAFDTDTRILRGQYRGTVDTRDWPDAGVISHDGSVLAWPFRESAELAEVWSTDETKLIGPVGERGTGGWGANGLAVSGDGALLAIAYLGRVQLWDTSELELLRVVTAPEVFGSCSYCGVFAVSLSPDGGWLAAAGTAPTVAVFDVATGALIREFPTPGYEHGDVAFSADGSRLAASMKARGNGYGLRVWDVQHGTVIYDYDYSLPNFRKPPLAFSADGARIVTTVERREMPARRTVRVVEISSGRAVFTLHTPTSSGAVALNPDGSQMAIETYISGEDGPLSRLEVLDVASGESLAQFSDAHRASWSADGRYLLAGSKLVEAASFTVLNDFVRGQLHQLELEAVPEYVDWQRYRVSGQLRIDGGEAIGFTGSVDGEDSQRYLRPQARLPGPASLVLELEGHPWVLYGHQPRRAPDGTEPPDPSSWKGSARDSSGPSDQLGWPFKLSRAP